MPDPHCCHRELFRVPARHFATHRKAQMLQSRYRRETWNSSGVTEKCAPTLYLERTWRRFGRQFSTYRLLLFIHLLFFVISVLYIYAISQNRETRLLSSSCLSVRPSAQHLYLFFFTQIVPDVKLIYNSWGEAAEYKKKFSVNIQLRQKLQAFS